MPSKTPNLIIECWNRLNKTKHLNLITTTFSDNKRILQHGVASVERSIPSKNSIVFNEKGFWNQDALSKTRFTNTFRWSLQLEKNVISLEHLRYGEKKPIFLFDLKPSIRNSLESSESYFCGEDTYSGKIAICENELYLSIRVIGPKKNQEISYEYS